MKMEMEDTNLGSVPDFILVILPTSHFLKLYNSFLNLSFRIILPDTSLGCMAALYYGVVGEAQAAFQ